jgi:hypothetical protein
VSEPRSTIIHVILLLTVDTNQLDVSRIERLQAAISVPHELVCVTVSVRERGEPAQVVLDAIPETMVWDESSWGEGVWGGPIPELAIADESLADEAVSGPEGHIDVFEKALGIISNGSFPPPRGREHLSDGQRRQLRDAMIYEAHVRHRRHVLVTEDVAGFIRDGRRQKLESLGQTRILTPDELEQLSANEELPRLLSLRINDGAKRE